MKDIDEAIQHCEDVAQQQDMLKGRYDDASGYTRSGNEAIRTSEAKKCEKCAADHRQLAEWLRELKQYKEKDKEISLKDITQVRLIEHLDEDAIARLNTTGALVAADMTEKIIERPFNWNDNLSKIAQENFSMIQKDLSYGTATTIGTALAKLELLEKQGCKVKAQESEEV